MLNITKLHGTGADKPILKKMHLEVLQQLPMEFAVEAQKLLGISSEGSVG